MSHTQTPHARTPLQVLAKLQAWLSLYPDQLPERLSADLLAAGGADGSGYIPKHKLYVGGGW